MRYLGLDLGTKTLGLSISDKSGLIIRPLPVIKFAFEDYEGALVELKKIINENKVDRIVLGLPKNMDGSIGFAGQRSMNFFEMLKKEGFNVSLEDERLTTKMAESIVHDNNKNVKETKDKIDSIAASIILESYLKRVNNGIEK